MKQFGEVAWHIFDMAFVIICLVLIVHFESQVSVGIRNEARHCIDKNYTVYVGDTELDLIDVSNLEDFLKDYTVIEIDYDNETVYLKKRT